MTTEQRAAVVDVLTHYGVLFPERIADKILAVLDPLTLSPLRAAHPTAGAEDQR